MKIIGDVISKIFNNSIQNKFSEKNSLNSEWHKILEEAFIGINDITAKKAADHSKIAYIKNNIIFIETDHQGWIQILQTIQKNIIKSINKKYSDISVNAIAFSIMNYDEKNKYEEKFIENKDMDFKISINDIHQKERYDKIKDKNLKKILMRLESQIKQE
jgi:ethanolamine utilization protein EutA (predicted chaperonin)